MNSLLVALASKLTEISENCHDIETVIELNELIEKIVESL